MRFTSVLAIVAVVTIASPAYALCPATPYPFTNGTNADAVQVNQNFANLQTCAAKSGANSDITSLTGLTTPLTTAQGGTGNTTGQPAGPAGGVLTGTYPNPGLANGSVSTGSIATGAVANTNLASMPANSIKGNNTGSTGTALDLTSAQATSLLSAVVGDSGSGGTKGLAPAPAAGDAAAGKFLKADGTWSLPLTSAVSSGSLSGSSVIIPVPTGYNFYQISISVVNPPSSSLLGVWQYSSGIDFTSFQWSSINSQSSSTATSVTFSNNDTTFRLTPVTPQAGLITIAMSQTLTVSSSVIEAGVADQATGYFWASHGSVSTGANITALKVKCTSGSFSISYRVVASN